MALPTWWYTIPLRLRSIFNRAAVERDDEELRLHLEHLIEHYLAAGMPVDDARRRAEREMGGLGRRKEECRDARGVSALEDVLRDMRHGVRALGKSHAFTAVAVATLALGIGANSALFSVLNAVFLAPLPFPNADRLVRVYSTTVGGTQGPSPLDVRDFAQANRTFEQIAVYDHWRKNVSGFPGAAEPEQMWVGLVPPAYFDILRIAPILGRSFTETENTYGRHFVAAIGEGLWRSRFEGDRGVLGRTIRINDEPYVIVAVMPDVVPRWMETPATVGIWTPFAPSATVWAEENRRERDYFSIGRLKPGISLAAAQADLAGIAARLESAYPVDRGVGVRVVSLRDTRVGSLDRVLPLLAGAVGLILLIACVNLVNLFLARNATRQREMVLRTALGATRGRLVGQLLVETVLLALAGGAAGLLVALAASSALERWHPERLPQLAVIAPDVRVFGFTLALSLMTGLVLGLAPAWMSSRTDLSSALRSGGRSTTGDERQPRLRQGLVASGIAFAVVLVASAGLLLRSLEQLRGQDLGFVPQYLVKAHIYLPPSRYPTPDAVTRFCDDLGSRLGALPGVEHASVVTGFPPAGRWVQRFRIAGQPVARVTEIPTAEYRLVDENYLATLGVRLVEGRGFSTGDRGSDAPVALVNTAFVRHYLAGASPLQSQIYLGAAVDPAGSAPPALRIIGVVADVKNHGLEAEAFPEITALYRQQPLLNSEFKDLLIRTALDPSQAATEARGVLHAMDPDLPLAEVATMEEVIAQQTGDRVFSTLIVGAFAALALILAAVGAYGVIAYLVTQRSSELGVRMAIGASPWNVLWLVMRESLGTALIGVLLGLVGAWVVGASMGRILFRVAPLDVLTLGATAGILLAVAFIATLVPAIRAMRIDPVQALRPD
jgi:putative ABC transport system permease protein